MESVQFVSNVFFTKLILGRKITRQQVLGTCLIILGCITAITFHIALGEGHSCGDKDGDRRLLSAGEECTESPGPHNVPYYMALYENPLYQGFFGFIVVGAFVLHLMIRSIRFVL